MSDKQWFLDEYDSTVSLHGSEGVGLSELIEEIGNGYAAAVSQGKIERVEVDLETEGRNLAAQYIKPARERRRTDMRKSCETLIDILYGNTTIADGDPVLDWAYPLGDGTDKTLRFWVTDDWITATTERYRNAASVTEAAKAFDLEISKRIIDALRMSGAQMTGDLFVKASA